MPELFVNIADKKFANIHIKIFFHPKKKINKYELAT